MGEKEFDQKASRLFEEAFAGANEDTSDFAIWSTVYEQMFNEPVPMFEPELSEDAKVKVLDESLIQRRSLSELTPLEFLQLQYRALFGESLIYNFMTIHTEEELLTALRESLKSGKPYELPDDVKQLIEQGADF